MDCFLGFDARMLLGALVDAGANPESVQNKMKDKGITASIHVSTTERASIVCKKVSVLAKTPQDVLSAGHDEIAHRVLGEYENSEGTDALCAIAAVLAIEELCIDYIITSEVSLGENTDGRVIEILNKAGIEIMPSDGSMKNMEPADASFLAAITNESGYKPPMNIISIGYGAGGESPDEPNIVNAIIGEFDSDNLFESQGREELIESL